MASILLLLTWYFSTIAIPGVILTRTAGSILYLGVIGSIIGFMLFFHVLQKVEITKAALIALITPCIYALLIGNKLNYEPLTAQIGAGTIMVLCSLVLFEYGNSIFTAVRKTNHSIKKRAML